MDDTPDRLTVNYKGEERELFMTFLRLNSCLRVIQDPRNLAAMMIDPDMSENVLRVMLAAEGGAGKMFDVELVDGDLSMADSDKILIWVGKHVTDFFVKRFQQAQTSAKDLEPMIKALESSSAGSGASSSTTPSAGPSA